MTRTDTIELPRIVATSSAPLTRPERCTARRLALLVLFAVGVVLAVVAGRAAAWQADAPTTAPAVVEPAGHRLELELPVDPDSIGTDAGLITTPAGDQ